jgi:hypothetical protein
MNIDTSFEQAFTNDSRTEEIFKQKVGKVFKSKEFQAIKRKRSTLARGDALLALLRKHKTTKDVDWQLVVATTKKATFVGLAITAVDPCTGDGAFCFFPRVMRMGRIGFWLELMKITLHRKRQPSVSIWSDEASLLKPVFDECEISYPSETSTLNH